MALIRNMVAQDLPYVYDIALKTAFAGLDGMPYYYDKWAVGHYYAAPYFFFEPEVCFTALNDQGVPSGFIVGTSDTRSFNRWMQNEWLVPLRKFYDGVTEFKSDAERNTIKQIIKGPGEGLWQNLGYPAHLHVDLLTILQGKGLGKALMHTFFSALQAKDVHGIHLRVDGRNVKAYGFYEAMGFSILEEVGGSAIFGIKLA